MAEGASIEGSGTRRLTAEERTALIDEPLAAILSTLAPAGWIHSVPVHFYVDSDEVRIVTRKASAKYRNALRTGRATLCVETSTPSERRYVSLEGTVRIEALSRSDIERLDEKYGRSDAMGFDDGDFEEDVLAVIHPERWIAWADWD
jgi:PPOX class probable F420-dependent enzyme